MIRGRIEIGTEEGQTDGEESTGAEEEMEEDIEMKYLAECELRKYWLSMKANTTTSPAH